MEGRAAPGLTAPCSAARAAGVDAKSIGSVAKAQRAQGCERRRLLSVPITSHALPSWDPMRRGARLVLGPRGEAHPDAVKRHAFDGASGAPRVMPRATTPAYAAELAERERRRVRRERWVRGVAAAISGLGAALAGGWFR